MGETYKNGDTLDGTQEGPLIHGASSGASGTAVPIAVNENGQLTLSTLVPEFYDELKLSYSGSQVTSVIYLNSGVTQATLTLAYDGDYVTNVVKT